MSPAKKDQERRNGYAKTRRPPEDGSRPDGRTAASTAKTRLEPTAQIWMHARLHHLRVGCVGNGFFTGDRDYRPVLMDRDIKKNCSVFYYLAVLFVFGRAVFRKGSCTFPMEKASALSHECRLSIPFFTENPSPILPESRMLSRASVLPRFVSAEIHLPF